MSQELCPDCIPLDYCVFEEGANETAKDPTLDPLGKQLQITQLREIARARRCPKLNDIDPDYPGKEGL